MQQKMWFVLVVHKDAYLVVAAPQEAELERFLDPRLRPAWTTWQNFVSKKKEESVFCVDTILKIN